MQNPVDNNNRAMFGKRLQGQRPKDILLEQDMNERQNLRSPEQMLQPKEVPAPPKRSTRARGGVVVLGNLAFSLMMLGVLFMGAVFYFGKVRFEETGPLDRLKTVTISQGSGLASISNRLENEGVISSGLIFRQGVKMSGLANKMKAGEYAFRPNMSMREVMNTIVSGKGVTYKITIPEGLTVYQIFQRLAANEQLVGDLPEILPPEGSLMPDTYPFQRGLTRAEVVKQMRRAQEKFVAEIWPRRVAGLPVKTPEELVILASIVEKETGKSDERPLVASVFINRLNKGMRLQTDPTVIYGIFGGKGKPSDRPIYRSDLKKPTPYNTYIITGLPPTPIANPGRASLEAVTNPSRTDYLYFVADGTGGHGFSKTLNEHNDKVARWRAIEKQMKEEAEKARKQAETGEGTGSSSQ